MFTSTCKNDTNCVRFCCNMIYNNSTIRINSVGQTKKTDQNVYRNSETLI